MPAIFSSIYLLKPWTNETTVTKAVTPTIIPSRVSADLSLCAQIAATATFRISKSFTLLIRVESDFGYGASVRTASGSDRIEYYR